MSCPLSWLNGAILIRRIAVISINHPDVHGITIGVDTNKDEHIAVAVDSSGVRIG